MSIYTVHGARVNVEPARNPRGGTLWWRGKFWVGYGKTGWERLGAVGSGVEQLAAAGSGGERRSAARSG